MEPHELKDQLTGLTAERAFERDEAKAWLADHPGQSRPELIRIVQNDEAGPRTYAAMEVLGRIGDPADVPLLEARLRSGVELLCWEAARALEIHPAPEALAALRGNLDNTEGRVVAAAAVALGSRGDVHARPDLERLLDHADPTLRFKAVFALKLLGPQDSRAALERRRAVETDEEVAEALKELLGTLAP